MKRVLLYLLAGVIEIALGAALIPIKTRGLAAWAAWAFWFTRPLKAELERPSAFAVTAALGQDRLPREWRVDAHPRCERERSSQADRRRRANRYARVDE